MEESLHFTNRPEDWLLIVSIAGTAATLLMYYIKYLWYEHIKQDVQWMINDAKTEVLKSIESRDVKGLVNEAKTEVLKSIESHDAKVSDMVIMIQRVDREMGVVKTRLEGQSRE